jgi:hypothetical protein
MQLSENSVEGAMQVVACTSLDPRELRAPCHITYVIRAPGVPAFSGAQVFEIWTAHWPQAGDELPVVFNRQHPDRVAIQWKRIRRSANRALNTNS